MSAVGEAIMRQRVKRARAKLLTGKRWLVSQHTGWGNSICFDRTERGQHHWYGWTPTAPKVGDEFVAQTEGGTAGFMVTSVERQRDPDDMWFATTHRIGEVQQ